MSKDTKQTAEILLHRLARETGYNVGNGIGEINIYQAGGRGKYRVERKNESGGQADVFTANGHTLSELCNMLRFALETHSRRQENNNGKGESEIKVWVEESGGITINGKNIHVIGIDREGALERIGELFAGLAKESFSEEFPFEDEEGNQGKILHTANNEDAAGYILDKLNGDPHYLTVWSEGDEVILERSEWRDRTAKDIKALQELCQEFDDDFEDEDNGKDEDDDSDGTVG